MIEVDDVTQEYGSGRQRVRVLDGVSLTVERGSIAAVVGPSGAGKSTLAKCVNLLERPVSGSVRVDGVDLTQLRDRALRDARHSIGTVFQDSSLLRRRTAAQNVALPLEFYGVTRAAADVRVRELLELVGLAGRGDTYVGRLSGGQQQRVGIARALALRPSVLLADEATSGLDPETTGSILGLLRDVRDELGLTVMLITHEMDVVRDVADTVHLLCEGRVVESGSLGEVLADPASDLGASLIPRREFATAVDGTRAWEVRYVAADVPTDWLCRASEALGVSIDLLGASIESAGGRPVGRAVVGVPSSVAALEVGVTLARLGLDVVPADAFGEQLEPTRIAS